MTLILALLLSGSTSFAQLVGNDSDYRVREINNYKYIYSSEYEQLTNDMVNKSFILKDIYEKEYQWVLDEDPTYVFASSNNQITNGFATQIPRLWTLFYNGGPGAIDQFAMTSWADTLMIHETVHLYQLNTRQGLSKVYKTVFGNAQPTFAIPFSYIISPHFFTPTFLLEGNATFNEGRFGNGGRLYSGYYRAMFLQLLKAEKLTPSRIINDHIDWPFGTEKYIVGGYFQSYLAEKFNPAQVNRYFWVHSARYLWPFMMDESFGHTYKQSFYSLYDDFKNEYKYLAGKQKQLNEPVLTTSHSHNAFTVNGDVVTFMTSKSRGVNKLCMFHKSKKKLKCEKSTLPMGRVFRHNKKWVTASYKQTHPTEIRAGLFGDGYERIDEFNDRYVYAKKGRHLTYADAKNSFDITRVYKNGRFIGDMQSSPFMDTRGNLYYFKQEGDRRQMYKNGNPKFSIYGYYGRVVDVSKSGKVYFTGPTHSGTSLFSWDGSTYSQEVDSDLVFDAKLLSGRDVLVAEVTAEGIETKFTKLRVQDGAPVLYEYEYQNKDMQRALSSKTGTKSEALDYEYSPLLEMEYTGVTPLFTYVTPDGSIWSLNFEFSDPLQRYTSNLILGDSGFETYTAQWIFRSNLNRLQWLISALYEEEALVAQTGSSADDVTVLGRYGETIYDLRFNYPIIDKTFWSSDLSFGYEHEADFSDDNIILANDEDVNAAIISYNYNYKFQNNLDYSAARFAGVELGYKYEGNGSAWENGTSVYTGEVGVQWDILWQSFLSASYKAAKADGDRRAIELNRSDIGISFDPSDFFRLDNQSTNINYLEFRKVNAEFKQAIPIGLYFSMIPIGVHRVAPFYGYSEFYGSINKDEAAETLFHESYYGAEVELLLFHKATTRIKSITIESSLGFTRHELSFGWQKDF